MNMQVQSGTGTGRRMPPPTNYEAQSLYSLAKAALERAGWKTEEAVEIMCDDVRSHKRLLNDIIERGCRSYVAAVAANRREAIASGSGTERNSPPGTSTVREAFVASALDTYVVCGKPLRDATQEDLRKSIDLHTTMANTHAQRARAETQILEAMQEGVRKYGPDVTVGKCLSEDQVSNLLRKYSLEAAE